MLGAGASLLSLPALAHHGWRWAEDGQFELTGLIREIYIGPPHGILEVDVDGEMWRVELGPSSRMRGAGLEEGTLSAGQEVLASGHRSKDLSENRMKAERITVAGVVYDMYPRVY
ncbi:hypothetical protein HPQ64_04625 [Rhizobiales bacterium]|nr:hypothetical protein [Hongsoonwoonella zoysiae]